MRALNIAIILIAVAAASRAATSESATGATCRPIPEAASLVTALNRFWGQAIRLCQSRHPDDQASAFPGDGVVRANRRWLAEIAEMYGEPAAAGIIAHEWGHMIQGRMSGVTAELHADCLAGAFMRRARFREVELDAFILVSLDSGDSRFLPGRHGTGSQRRDAVLRGYYGFRGQDQRQIASFCRL
ncbi:MAG: hypothetical protein ACXWUN_07640 [Allosphingosinicella sp.]